MKKITLDYIKSKKNKIIKLSVVALLSSMVVGYSVITIALDIKQKTLLGFNFDDVNIYIANANLNGINKYNSINETKNEINIEIEPGDSLLDIYVSNNAINYNEEIRWVCNTDSLSGVQMTPSSENKGIIIAQEVEKQTFNIVNSGTKQTLRCTLNYKEIEIKELAKEKKVVIFASDGFPSTVPYKIVDDVTYGELPTITKQKYAFMGWENSSKEGIDANTSIKVFSDEVLFAHMEYLKAEILAYNNKNTGIECNNVQCALDELASIAERIR